MPKVEIIYGDEMVWSGKKWEDKRDASGEVIQYKAVRKFSNRSEWKSELQNELKYVCDNYPNIMKITFLSDK